MTAIELNINQKAIIVGITNPSIDVNLQQYGFIIGDEIELKHVTFFNSTYTFLVNNSLFALRKKDARLMKVSLI